ncbi:MAG TPA: 4-oxalocrotonate tautomerase [Ramlibacter sp.]|jgi:4-oxalocrotonate tautomerase|nr:4-oxalocrotonate tautomerase [Ramlibacter sp.]
MPILKVKVSAAPSPAMTREIAETLLELTTRILRKKRELTAITIEYVPPEHWVVGGATLAAQGKTSFYFDIKIVDGTNTKDEKAQYVREAFAAFARLLPDVHEESYIHVEDVRPEAYGYGGLTQEYRYVRAQL